MQATTEMTTAQMLAEYNELTGKSVKKFSTRAAGESQLIKARAEKSAEQQTEEKEMEQNTNTETNDENVEQSNNNEVAEGATQVAEGVAADGATQVAEGGTDGDKEPKESTRSRSEGVSDSWKNPEVAEKRRQRNGVIVAGIVYRSVLHAFQELDLPINKHIAFRAELKAAGEKTFTHDDKEYSFKIAPVEVVEPKEKAPKKKSKKALAAEAAAAKAEAEAQA